MKVFKWIVITAVSAVVIFMSGGLGVSEIEHSDIVAGAAIDYDENSDIYKLTLEIFVPSQEVGFGGETRILKAEGDTIEKAWQNAQNSNLKRLFTDGIKLFVLDGYTSQNAKDELTAYFIENSGANPQALIAVADGDLAENVLTGERDDNTSTRALDFVHRIKVSKTDVDALEFLSGKQPPLVTKNSILDESGAEYGSQD